MRDYTPSSGNATDAGALGQYHYVNGDIDGVYIEANGPGLYYATGPICAEDGVAGDERIARRGPDDALLILSHGAGSPSEGARRSSQSFWCYNIDTRVPLARGGLRSTR